MPSKTLSSFDERDEIFFVARKQTNPQVSEKLLSRTKTTHLR